MYTKRGNVKITKIVSDLRDAIVDWKKVCSVVTQKRVRHLIKRYCNDLDIKLVFSSFKIASLFGVKDPVPGGFIRVLYTSLHVQAVMPVMSAKQPGIFPHACVSI